MEEDALHNEQFGVSKMKFAILWVVFVSICANLPPLVCRNLSTKQSGDVRSSVLDDINKFAISRVCVDAGLAHPTHTFSQFDKRSLGLVSPIKSSE